ncbi:MAG: tRNA pseudouridine(38-40) synthase TruA [Pseudomonadota bacterium]
MPFRYKLILEFDGGPFVGWQRQTNGLSIQEALEEAVFRFCSERVSATGAGRTDAGVHALAMPAHIDLLKEQSCDVVRDAINFHLKPYPIAVTSVYAVNQHFHARFSAAARHYLYRFATRRAPLALDAGRAWRIPATLNVEAMHEAAQSLTGKHDFTTFRAAQCQAKSPVRTLSEISVTETGEGAALRVCAPSFLHHQVRSIAGSLAQVGLGKWSKAEIAAALKAADRKACGPVAPAEGLYFVKADYPADG